MGALPLRPVPLTESAWNQCVSRPNVDTCRTFTLEGLTTSRSSNPPVRYRGTYVTGLTVPELVVPMQLALCDDTKLVNPETDWPVACAKSRFAVQVKHPWSLWQFEGIDVELLRLQMQKPARIMWFPAGALTPSTWSTVFEVVVKEQ